jgi:hypothetical protein
VERLHGWPRRGSRRVSLPYRVMPNLVAAFADQVAREITRIESEQGNLEVHSIKAMNPHLMRHQDD